MKDFSNLSNIVYKRTYSRLKENGQLENWDETAERVVMGNVKGHNVPEKEIQALLKLLRERKAGPAGRGLWMSGTPQQERLSGAALTNCWFFTSDDWNNYVLAQDMLMLGGGVGFSVENRFSSKLPKIKKDVKVVHKATKDAEFIVPDSREGWCELTRRVLESFFVTGRSFSYSTVCVRGAGEPIKGFGGVSSGPLPMIKFVETVCSILSSRAGKSLNPIDTSDILTAIAAMVVAGNVRRSAILILGDCYDKDFLRIKRWDLGTLPAHRSNANYSVVCDDVDDLHPLFWKSYEIGEAIGIVNRRNMQKYGRMGEFKKDTAVGVNPCGEATLENGEPCNLTEIALPNIENEEEFVNAAVLMHRYAKRVTLETYYHKVSNDVIKKNRRVGCGITGCLASPLFNSKSLDRAYEAIQMENIEYSEELGINPSIRTTVIKPSGTWSKLADCKGFDGCNVAGSRWAIQRIRFAANDKIISDLKKAGHHIEPVIKLDGTLDHDTLVADFYVEVPKEFPVYEEGFDTWKQLDTLMMAQKHWSDQSVSITVYYNRDEIPKIKEWLADNLKNIKTISFMSHTDHGFKQAPKESITKEQYEELSSKISPIRDEDISMGDLDNSDCAGGMCPIK